MAYDPEARRQSNSALIIGAIALIALVGGGAAYMATRPNPEPTTTIVNSPVRDRVVTNTVTQQVPVDVTPNTVVVTPPTTRTVERNTTTVRERVIAPPPASSAPAPAAERGSSETNVTINNSPPATEANPAPEVTSASPETSSDSAPANTESSSDSNSSRGY